MALQPRFRGIIESLSMAMQMEQVVNSVRNGTLSSSSASD